MKLREEGEAASPDLIDFDTWRDGYPGEPLGTGCFIYMKNLWGKVGIKTSYYVLCSVLVGLSHKILRLMQVLPLVLEYGKKLGKGYGT